MKKLLLLLPAFLLLLTACNAKEKTEAETYLENHSEQEIVAYFEQLTFTYESFNDPKELSNEALLNFFTAGPNLAGPLDLEQWLDEENKYEDPWWYEVCTAKIVDGEPQFTSYQTPVYPNQTEQ